MHVPVHHHYGKMAPLFVTGQTVFAAERVYGSVNVNFYAIIRLTWTAMAFSQSRKTWTYTSIFRICPLPRLDDCSFCTVNSWCGRDVLCPKANESVAVWQMLIWSYHNERPILALGCRLLIKRTTVVRHKNRSHMQHLYIV